MRTLSKLFSILGLLLLAPAVRAQNPALINYQGRLSDSLGAAVTGTRAMTFRIYDASSQGTKLWEETQGSVAVTNGAFSVQLGAAAAFDPSIFSGPNAYLEIQIGSETLTPRRRLVSVPYAANSELFQGKDASSFVTKDLSGGISTPQLCLAGDCKSAWPAAAVSTQWTTSGLNIYYSSGAGSVGIGTTNPNSTLEINGNLRLTRTQGTSDLVLAQSAAAATPFSLLLGSSHIIDFTSSNIPILPQGLITGVTDLKIGTAGMTRAIQRGNTGPRLSFGDPSLAGDAAFRLDSNVSFGPGTSLFDVRNAGATKLLLDASTGNFGVGTSSPTQKLHLGSGGLLLDNDPSISVATELGAAQRLITGASWARGWGFIDSSNAVKASFGAKGTGSTLDYAYIGNSYATPWMTLASWGGVGIGVGSTAPTAPAKLTVFDNSTAILKLEGGTNGAPARRSILDLKSDVDYRARGVLMESGDGAAQWYAGVPYTGAGFTIGRDASLPEYKSSSLLFISAAGDVGISTGIPQAKLDVAGSVKATSFIGDGSQLTGLPGGSDPTKVLKTGDSMSGALSITGTDSAPQFNFSVGTSGTAFGIRVTTNNLVAIGNSLTPGTLPTVPLQVFGSANVSSNVQGGVSNVLTVQNPNSPTPTNFAEARLLFRAGTTSGGIQSMASVGGRVTDVSNGQSALVFTTGQGGTLTEYMRLTGAGNLGIGTNSPSGFGTAGPVLQLTAIAPGAPELILDATPISQHKYALVSDGTGLYARDMTAASTPLQIGLTGNVGIGTTNPQAQLDVVGGNVRSDTGFCIGASCITSWPSGAASQWTTSGSDIFYNTGNVGIGSTAPIRKLDVAGSVRVTGGIDFTTPITIANGATGFLPQGEGFFFIQTVGNPNQRYAFGIRTGNGPTALIANSGFTTTQGNSGTVNVYGEGAPLYRLTIENRTGGSVSLFGMILGSSN